MDIIITLAGAACVFLLLRIYILEGLYMKEMRAAIKLILENDGCVVFDTWGAAALKNGSWQLYASSAGYTVLHFDKNSDLISGDEEHFAGIDEAIAAFVIKIPKKVSKK